MVFPSRISSFLLEPSGPVPVAPDVHVPLEPHARVPVDPTCPLALFGSHVHILLEEVSILPPVVW